MNSHTLQTVASLDFRILDLLDEPYMVCNAGKKIVYYNRAFSDLSRDSLLSLGMDAEAFFASAAGDHSGGRSELFAALSEWFFHEGTSSVGQFELPGANALVRYIGWRLAIIFKGKPHTLLCLKNCTGFFRFDEEARTACKGYETLVYEQVEELKRLNASLRIENAERNAVSQALRRAESRYRDIFDNALEGIFQWTPEGHLLSANRSCAHMLGYPTVNDLLDYTATGGFNFCYIAQVCEQLMEELESKGSVTNFEFELCGANGNALWVNLNARRVLGLNGKTSYY